jgi:uncharacterized membrane-anchored protein
MTVAAILFVLAALGGITMLVLRLRGMERPPLLLAVGHGIIALSGIVALGYAYSQAELPTSANWALAVFILAALGGVSMFVGFHLRKRPLPIPFILGHGLIAATAVGLLLYAIFG